MIQLNNISKSFEVKATRIDALKDISLSIEKGEIFGVIGASGAGKSTLIRCVNLLERPDSGQVIIENDDLMSLSSTGLMLKRRKIGMIFQHFNLLSSRTVYGNISFPLELEGKSKEFISQKVLELLRLVGLEDKADVYPANLSGGQKQRVAIARALANDPYILLCDEATSALDPATTKSILKLLKKINKQLDLTILLITHEMDVIKSICDQVAVLDHGELIETGPVESIFANPQETTTKNFIQSSLEVEIPLSFQERLKSAGNPLVEIYLTSNEESIPFIQHLEQQYQVKTNIITAQIDYIGEMKFGVILAELSGEKENVTRSLSFLKEKHSQTKILGYV
ncbi:methionine ABC transporter ATP-binding protein [Sphingobacterium multivorum]|jgi:D-methionine transport system ATP-binding protein|uniref:Cell division ATP-binding protein FtsE n=2 Tax=Sphingobacterium TaxID=28453 RepID=A0A562N0R4_9SPHI|nr:MULTISPECIES: methionine ABC transporter ATP-binding protein [Sphingobacterium]QMV67315.1 methionine ABC transporter ATP-binding protein [Sphingobacterium paramultivorum]TWI25716.1 D-methionine transport system ATP-binding protein [Sphingobacterium siyangense]WSO16171.1 methionine ABC transporter ATP-binding protein [Sphingobacterium paramultivorum]